MERLGLNGEFGVSGRFGGVLEGSETPRVKIWGSFGGNLGVPKGSETPPGLEFWGILRNFGVGNPPRVEIWMESFGLEGVKRRFWGLKEIWRVVEGSETPPELEFGGILGDFGEFLGSWEPARERQPIRSETCKGAWPARSVSDRWDL